MKFDTLLEGLDKNNFFYQKLSDDLLWHLQLAKAYGLTASLFKTGSAPGSAKQVGQTCVFGLSPKLV